MRRVLRGVMLLAFTWFLAGCEASPQTSPWQPVLESPTASVVRTLAPSTVKAPQATETPEPTVTAPPTGTSRPTAAPTATPMTAPSPSSTPADTPTPTIFVTSIGAITVDRVGDELTLEAEVVDTASFSKGFQFTLDGGSGQIVLLMWHSIFDDCWDASKINLGPAVRVTGEVSEYEGRLEVHPRFGGDVKAIHSAPRPVAPREIHSITSADEGEDVVIEGRVVRTEGLPSAVKVFAADDSGEILVFIWRSVLDRVVDNAGLGTPGSRVRVSGRVQVYRSNLEVVPTLPNDVTVLEIP